MKTVNQAVILIEENNSKMFPFDNESLSEISIGNQENIKRIYNDMIKLEIEKIVVIGKDLRTEKRILSKENNVEYIEATDDMPLHLSEVIQEETLVYNIRSYVDYEDLKKLVIENKGLNRSLVERNTLGEFKYKDYICAQAEEYIQEYYAHPRPSYVNSRSVGVFILNKEMIPYLKYSSNKFENINVGVISSDGFHIEQCINEAIKDGYKIKSEYCEQSFVHLKFPWDILEANYLETTKIKQEVISGNNTIIDDSVIFEGSAKIGDNCQIFSGAIIQDGVIIGDNTIVTNYAKISKNTVIGRKNKIGYMAEVTGVTNTNVAIVHNSHISGLIGSNVDIGAGTNTANLRFDDLDQSITVDSRRYSNKFTNYSYIGESTRTGIGVLISPGVRIGRNSAIGSGAILNSDVSENELVLVEQEHTIKKWGKHKHGW